MFSFSLFFFNLLIYVPFWFLCFSWERQEQGWALIKSKVSACMSIWTHLTLQIPGQQESNLVLLPTLLRKRAENLRLEGKDFMFFNFPLCWRGKVFPTDRCQESQSLWNRVFSYGPLCSSLSSTATWNETLLMSSILGKAVVIVKLGGISAIKAYPFCVPFLQRKLEDYKAQWRICNSYFHRRFWPKFCWGASQGFWLF